MRWSSLLWAVSILSQSTQAIFADEAFHIDYHFALLGLPLSHTTFFHKPQSASNASLLYTISSKAVLGAINPKDGTTLWRQPLSTAPVTNATNALIAAGEKDGQITSGYENVVQCWDALDGKLRWDYVLEKGARVRGLQTVPSSATADSSPQDIVVLVVGVKDDVKVVRLAGNSGGVKWEHSDTSLGAGASVSLAAAEKTVYYISLSHGLLASNKAKVALLEISTGKETKHYSVAVDNQPISSVGQYVAGACSGNPFLISSDKPHKTIKFNLLGNSKSTTLTLDEHGEEVEELKVLTGCGSSAPPHFLVHYRTATRSGAEVYHINLKSGEAVKAYSLPATAESSVFAATNVGTTTYFVRSTDSEVVLYSSKSHGQLARFSRKGAYVVKSGTPTRDEHAVAEVVQGQTGFAVRVVESSASGELSLVRNGEMQWSRPEMLAYASMATWADDQARDELVEELEVEASANPLVAYVHRLKRHVYDITSLPAWLSNIPGSLLRTSDDSGISSRQTLIGQRLAILVSDLNEIIAVDAAKGGIVRWQTNLASIVQPGTTFKSLFVADGRTTLYLSDGSFIVVNNIDGSIIEHQPGTIPATRLIQIPGSQAPAVIKVDADGKPQVATDFAPPSAVEGNAIVTLSDAGNAFGWTIGQSVERTWTIQPPTGAKFINAISRPDHDPVASIGKVLGDRSVLYKYISPNLALLTAASSTAVAFYLIDAVTGAILHTSTHKGIIPGTLLPAVMSENWYAYSFTSRDPITSALSTQLVIAELYESELPNDRGALSAKTNYSSFSSDAGPSPFVISKAFTLAEPLSSMAVTKTAQGITSRQILASLPNTHAIIGIPRDVLNARRPVDRDATALEQEEGLFRYSPILDLEPRFHLTHSREVMGIRKIMAAPTLLESTTLVFAFGHDVFGTHLAPSMAFDILGKGFNRIQLSLTVVALFLGVMVVRPLVRQKMTERQWTT